MDKINIYITDIVRDVKRRQTRKFQNLMASQNRHPIPECKHQFYPRTSNLTSIIFDEDELNLLNTSLKYNLPHANRRHGTREIISAETAIKTIKDPNLQK